MTNKLDNVDRRRKAVLILECDSNKLTEQNLAVGGTLETITKSAFPRNHIQLVKSYTKVDLLESLATLAESRRLFRSIVIIGHSNQTGLQIAADSFIEWKAVANWISPFQPHRVVLLACKAGQAVPCASLFEGVQTLKEIFASPINANKNQQFIVLGKVLHVLYAKKESEIFNLGMQLVNLVITQGVMTNIKREQYE